MGSKFNGCITKVRAAFILLATALLLQVPGKVHGQEVERSPYYLKTQFAGDIGLVAVGFGREHLQEKLETDLFLGYLPASVGGEQILTAALKATYIPFQDIPLAMLDWQPFRTGLQLGYTFGDDYFGIEPRDQYPKGYYGFSTALHLYYFMGGELDLARVEGLEKLGLYYEVGTIGKYLISYLQNPGYLGPGKIFHLALGVKVSL
ncbi:hypothetical protein [Pontibacter actiniarum]|uniref:hypothetical protein n=1 Tax=Pontibacter actiniarum TaxID=323450 RepID=UPI0012FA550C|nr:hypothetical protein [Pontibacter actiniarum]